MVDMVTKTKKCPTYDGNLLCLEKHVCTNYGGLGMLMWNLLKLMVKRL